MGAAQYDEDCSVLDQSSNDISVSHDHVTSVPLDHVTTSRDMSHVPRGVQTRLSAALEARPPSSETVVEMEHAARVDRDTNEGSNLSMKVHDITLPVF